jgi:antitoxin (DNA-binding transcriptional repressor) of toxin-antitoxin stability system
MYMFGAQHVHMKEVTLTELRRNIFRLIDEALATGESIVVKRKGHTVKVVPERADRRGERPAPNDKEAWARFWATPSEIQEDLTLEEIEAAGEAYWQPREWPPTKS